MEAVFNEGMRLESEGKWDKDVEKAIDARMKEISDGLDRDVANHLLLLSHLPPGKPARFMPKFVNYLLAIFGIFLAGAGFVGLRSSLANLLWVAIGIVLLFIAYRSDKNRSQQDKNDYRSDVLKRANELTGSPWPDGKTLEIGGNTKLIVMFLLGALMGAVMIFIGLASASSMWLIGLFGGFLLAFSLLILVRGFVGLGKPACILDRKGLTMPIYGMIPWQSVSGIHLLRFEFRGSVNYTLQFRIEQIRRVVKHVHWTEHVLGILRLGALGKGIISLPMKDMKEKPETVYGVARFLWKQATGNDYDWDPDVLRGFQRIFQAGFHHNGTQQGAGMYEPASAAHIL